ncbi:hypothetical protein TcCL_NonESM10018 [Trypanosoma cruzi]|nr:hypothetical protein TcCL_NonESM10018 [Trypanosoma cruzi]
MVCVRVGGKTICEEVYSGFFPNSSRNPHASTLVGNSGMTGESSPLTVHNVFFLYIRELAEKDIERLIASNVTLPTPPAAGKSTHRVGGSDGIRRCCEGHFRAERLRQIFVNDMWAGA